MHFFETFSTSEPPKVVRDRQFLTLLTWKCASRHNGVHFFDISTSKIGPRMVCFVHLTSKCASRHNGVHFFDISTSKSGPRMVLYILTSKCASRHNGVHFFDISTSKSGPTMVCFIHFDFKMCFAPQRRALFRHLNFQKWSAPSSVLAILTWKCASRHNGVHFFMSHLASWLRTRRFSEPTFRPSGATNHWKNTVNRRLSYLFAHLPLLSSDLFSSDSSHLCFSTVHIVGSFTSKLPSIIYIR